MSDVKDAIIGDMKDDGSGGLMFAESLQPIATWEWRIAKDEYGVIFSVVNAPCWFHRMAQRVILGIVWTRKDTHEN